MKKLFIITSILFSFSSFGREMYVYCGKGPMETMDSFIATGILNKGEAHLIFSVGKLSYSVIFENNKYAVRSTDGNIDKYKTVDLKAAGEYKESELFDGISCHVNY